MWFDKYENYILGATGALCLLVLIIFMIVVVDFYNDYKCSTTTDPEYFKENNCIRYFE